MNSDSTYQPSNDPLSAPSGYHEEFHRKLMQKLERDEWQNEAPVLASLNKPRELQAPDNYFTALPELVQNKLSSGKVVSIQSRLWFRLAAAAAIIALVVTFFRPDSNEFSGEISLSEVEQSTLDNYLDVEFSAYLDEDDLAEIASNENNRSFTFSASTDELTRYLEEEAEMDDMTELFAEN